MMNIFEIILLQPLANGLVLSYQLVGGDMGLAIIVFSLFLRFILNPLTKPYLESMKKMKEFAPQLEKIKKRHEGDKQKQLQAQADFYKEKGINPGAGCLPYLLQIVVLIAFFNVFSRTLVPNGDVVANFNELLYGPLKFAEGVAIDTQFLYFDVTQPDVINTALPFPLPGPMLILAAAIQFVSARISAPFTEEEEEVAKETKEKSDDLQVTMQKSMSYTFPLFTLIIGLRFASGLVLYWLLFSLYQAIQQYNTSGWGALTPWIRRLGLLKSTGKKNGSKKRGKK